MKSNPSVSVGFMKMLLEFGSEQKLDTKGVLRSQGIDPSVLNDHEERVSQVLYDRVFQELERQSRDTNFGLRLGQFSASIGSGHILVAMMRSCATVRDALERVLRYHGLVSDAFSFSFVVSGREALVTLVAKHAGRKLRLPSAQVEQLFAMLNSLMRALTRHELKLTQVCFQHRRPANAAEHRRVFGVEPTFDASSDRLGMSLEGLSTPLPMADSALLETLERLLERRLSGIEPGSQWTARAERKLLQVLSRGESPTFSGLASLLSTGEKALRRSLKQEGTTYKLVLDAVRHELAKQYVEQGDISLFDIAFMLGYTEQSTFNHAFRRWTGLSPREFRRQRMVERKPQ